MKKQFWLCLEKCLKIFESPNKWQAGIPAMMSKETDSSRLSPFTKGIFSCKPDKKILDKQNYTEQKVEGKGFFCNK